VNKIIVILNEVKDPVVKPAVPRDSSPTAQNDRKSHPERCVSRGILRFAEFTLSEANVLAWNDRVIF